ncbi:esterase/lipase family protein [Xanthomonas pisi]|uniref:esterase/lipase family protein n=1 Tax=Xanthomonas pisi TaxID=56457 RepID=UPI000699BB25|nr:alpha/beta fold hydrolase [Xanthomonas pisi]
MKTWSSTSLHSVRWVLLCAVLGSGCAMVTLKPVTPEAYLQTLRGDALSTGTLGSGTLESLRVLGLDAGSCADARSQCVEQLMHGAGLPQERRLSAAAEVSLLQALKRRPAAGAQVSDAELTRWLQTARYAYAYLFYSGRSPSERAFEDRQTQVRDYYNYATEQSVAALFQRYRQAEPRDGELTRLPAPAPWTVTLDVSELGPIEQMPMPQAILSASTMRFDGLRSVYRRDGFGTAMVAVLPGTHQAPPAADADIATGDFNEMHTPNVTVLLRFHGSSLAQVLGSTQVTLEGHDPLQTASSGFGDYQAPLAGNFTAGYGVWLARAGFADQSLRTFFGLKQGISKPQVFMLQPYDPNRRVLLLLHGLASSPEAWVNMANEVLGDAALRERYQIWLVYYPTNLPLPYNHIAVRRTIETTLQHFDPAGNNAASHGMVLVGHSMGGILARLMVSSSRGDTLWLRLFGDLSPDSDRVARARRKLGPMLEFTAMPSVGRAVFIAAPHRGTPAADGMLAGVVRRFVVLPATLLGRFADVMDVAGTRPDRLPTSMDNLRDSDPFIQAAAELSISPNVPYHSIIARRTLHGPLASSGDGFVPYRSAHLDGARSEKVILSGHSVQETPAAILEIRRILRQDSGLPDALPASLEPLARDAVRSQEP